MLSCIILYHVIYEQTARGFGDVTPNTEGGPPSTPHLFTTTTTTTADTTTTTTNHDNHTSNNDIYKLQARHQSLTCIQEDCMTCA